MSSNKGFTLVEVLIAIAILAIISVMTSDSIQRSLRMKVKIQSELDAESKLRNALRIIERDINLAFHSRNLDYELFLEMKKVREASGATAGPIPGDDGNPPLNFTEFEGNSESLYFTTLSHVRMGTDVPEGDQAKVGYYLQGCSGFSKGEKKNTKCLYRSETPYLDEKIRDGGTPIPLLENVESFKLKYYGKDKKDWDSQWKSAEGTSDDATRGQFPLAVEVTISTKNNDRDLSLSAVIPLRFPNNKKEKKDGADKPKT